MNIKKKENNTRHNFQLARNLAGEKLKSMDIDDVADKSGCIYKKKDDETGFILIDYLGGQVSINESDMTLNSETDDWTELGGPITLGEEIFILHYLINASGKLPSGNLIPFHSMNGGMTYNDVFRARAVGQLVDVFRNREAMLLKVGIRFCGISGDLGSASLRLRVLPHVELALVLWKGDDEIPSSGNILFDDSILDYLPTEDCVVMAETVVNRIIKVCNQNIDKESSFTKDT